MNIEINQSQKKDILYELIQTKDNFIQKLMSKGRNTYLLDIINNDIAVVNKISFSFVHFGLFILIYIICSYSCSLSRSLFLVGIFLSGFFLVHSFSFVLYRSYFKFVFSFVMFVCFSLIFFFFSFFYSFFSVRTFLFVLNRSFFSIRSFLFFLSRLTFLIVSHFYVIYFSLVACNRIVRTNK